eukprot:CAMPEP_0170460760 /NCGR_PEP_ID=MMETSP0123-20130129/6967_1 /TAXON_ID=182087 /ORGANISM="Favella ehrenbergii, Strain Fehren 1" /LENGTH=83 /DNA_ID=CAMNT_0010725705 /DNA_START=1631 /DNA_END=1882 /DNA_ORIENTATION=-
MDDLGLVKVVQTAKDVVNNRLDLGLLEVLAGLDELLKVHVALAQHKVDLVECEVHKRRRFIVEDVGWRYDSEKLVAARVLHRL